VNVALLEELLGLLKTVNETIGVPQGESLEDKNVLQGNNPSDPNKRVTPTLNSNERKRTTEIASLFAKTFFEYQKKKTPDKAIKTSIQKVTGKTGEKIQQGGDKVDAKSSWWKILLPLVVGIGALIAGLMTDGPFKGALKMLARLGLGIVERQIKMILKIARGLMPDKLIGNLFEKLIPKNFIGNLIKRLLSIDDIVKMVTSGMTGFISSLKGMISAPFKALGGMVKGGSIMTKMVKFLKPMLLVLKRIPLIGTIISFGFAISRFSSGDTVGGVIDVLSGLAGLLDLVAPGLGTTLSIGLDVLNAFLDVKTGGATGKQQGAKMDLLGDMAKGIGKWIWKNALWLPVIGGFKRMEMSWDALKSGNIMESIKQFAFGMLSFTSLGPIVTGIEMLLGFGDEKKTNTKDIKKGSLLGSMTKNIGNWIWKNALWLPVIGGFKRMEMSWNAFKSGDIMGGLYQFGASLLSFGGLGPIVTGIEMLLGFGDKKESDKSLSPKTGWFSGLKAWIKKKLKNLPWVLRKPLEWFGILDDSDEDTSIKTSILNSAYDKLKKFASSMWSGITSSLALVGDLLVKGVTTLYNNVKQTLSDAASAVKNAAVEVHNKQVKKYRGLAEKDASTRVVESVKNPFGTIYGAGAEIVALGASRRDAAASEEAFSKKQKELIKRGILNPDGTPRSREERVKSGLAKPLPTQDKTVVSDAIKTVKIPQKTQDKTVVSDTPNPNALPVVQSGNSQSLEFLRNIGMTQIKIMGDIKGIAAQILKKMDSSMGGSNSNTVVPISQPPSSQKSSPMPMNSNRGDYGSSAYALA
jgi:Flp pilus assembly pilin Flp